MRALSSLFQILIRKAAPRGGKYYKRVATGKPGRPWQYFYTRGEYEKAHGSGKDMEHGHHEGPLAFGDAPDHARLIEFRPTGSAPLAAYGARDPRAARWELEKKHPGITKKIGVAAVIHTNPAAIYVGRRDEVPEAWRSRDFFTPEEQESIKEQGYLTNTKYFNQDRHLAHGEISYHTYPNIHRLALDYRKHNPRQHALNVAEQTRISKEARAADKAKWKAEQKERGITRKNPSAQVHRDGDYTIHKLPKSEQKNGMMYALSHKGKRVQTAGSLNDARDAIALHKQDSKPDRSGKITLQEILNDKEPQPKYGEVNRGKPLSPKDTGVANAYDKGGEKHNPKVHEAVKKNRKTPKKADVMGSVDAGAKAADAAKSIIENGNKGGSYEPVKYAAGIKSKKERLAKVYRKLGKTGAASSHDEAVKQVSDALKDIEDHHSGVPEKPENWQTDGRMYPAQPDRIKKHSSRSDVTIHESKGHESHIGDNGAIHIKDKSGKLEFRKKGKDGKHVY